MIPYLSGLSFFTYHFVCLVDWKIFKTLDFRKKSENLQKVHSVINNYKKYAATFHPLLRRHLHEYILIYKLLTTPFLLFCLKITILVTQLPVSLDGKLRSQTLLPSTQWVEAKNIIYPNSTKISSND